MTSTCRKGGWEGDLLVFSVSGWEVGQAIGNRHTEPQCSQYPVPLTPLKYFVAVRPLIFVSARREYTTKCASRKEF